MRNSIGNEQHGPFLDLLSDHFLPQLLSQQKFPSLRQIKTNLVGVLASWTVSAAVHNQTELHTLKRDDSLVASFAGLKY
jgi:hypothetical protein